VITRIAVALASVGGIGYIPFAPGTFGSAAGLAIWWLLPQTPPAQAAAKHFKFASGS
jgi:hypothetical protein